MTFETTYDRRVRYSDSDAQGIVFNPNYLVYWDDTLTDWITTRGLTWQDVHDRGYEMVLAHVEVDYRASARVGDTVRTGIGLERVGRTSMTFAYRSWDPDSDRTFVEGHQVQVVVDAATFSPTDVPDFLKEPRR